MKQVMKIFLSTLFITLVFTQAHSQVYHRTLYTDKFFQKLVGSWKLKNKPTLEQWIKSSSGVYKARVINLKKGDSLLTETIQVIEDVGIIYYVATVLNQNNGEPIRFQLIKQRRKRLKFSNKQHDFPQYIEYHLVDKNHLTVRISGMLRKKLRKVEFEYERVK